MRVHDRLGVRRTRDVGRRLEAHSVAAGDCRLWLGSKTSDGYGRISVGGRDRLAHVVAFERRLGPVPQGLVLDHTCRVRHCIAVEHLEPVTQAENTRRGELSNRSGKCRRGHSVPDGGRCRTCRAAAQRAWYERKLEGERLVGGAS